MTQCMAWEKFERTTRVPGFLTRLAKKPIRGFVLWLDPGLFRREKFC
jgi:hypothetical protein